MESRIHTYTYQNGEIEKVQEVILDSFDDLKILKPEYNRKSFDNLCDLYRDFIIRKYKAILGTVILFTLDNDLDIPFDSYDEKYGHIYDPYVKVASAFKRNIRLKNKKLVFKDKKTEEFFNLLRKRKLLDYVNGDRNYISIMPVNRNLGFISESKGKLKVNSSFFVFDVLDVASIYDSVGTAIGFIKKNDVIYNPPLFDRETLLVDKNDKVSIRSTSLSDIKIIIDGVIYEDKINCQFISRPGYKTSPAKGVDIIINNNKVVAVKSGGRSIVPAGGYIIHIADKKELKIKDRDVVYKGYDDYKFALQVSNSAVREGKMTEGFVSSFYDLKRFYKPSYPPSMYPLNYEKDRAPRIVLGVNRDNKPVLLWFEGAGKFGYEKGKDSIGASLKEVAEISLKLGLINAINLDGGGSAQIIIDGKRELKISDRDPSTFLEKQRAVPFGLYIE